MLPTLWDLGVGGGRKNVLAQGQRRDVQQRVGGYVPTCHVGFFFSF